MTWSWNHYSTEACFKEGMGVTKGISLSWKRHKNVPTFPMFSPSFHWWFHRRRWVSWKCPPQHLALTPSEISATPQPRTGYKWGIGMTIVRYIYKMSQAFLFDPKVFSFIYISYTFIFDDTCRNKYIYIYVYIIIHMMQRLDSWIWRLRERERERYIYIHTRIIMLYYMYCPQIVQW